MVERGYVEDGEEAGVRRTEREKGSRKREGSRQEEPGAKTVEGQGGRGGGECVDWERIGEEKGGPNGRRRGRCMGPKC